MCATIQLHNVVYMFIQVTDKVQLVPFFLDIVYTWVVLFLTHKYDDGILHPCIMMLQHHSQTTHRPHAPTPGGLRCWAFVVAPDAEAGYEDDIRSRDSVSEMSACASATCCRTLSNSRTSCKKRDKHTVSYRVCIPAKVK